MSASLERRRHRRQTWLALLIGVSLFILISFLAWPAITGPDVEHEMGRIAIGSKVSDLEQQLAGSRVERWDVWEWQRVEDGSNGSGETLKNEFGLFHVVDKGPYDRWVSSIQERDRFTGVINLGHFGWRVFDNLSPSFQISLTYVDGKLVGKSYAILAG